MYLVINSLSLERCVCQRIVGSGVGTIRRADVSLQRASGFSGIICRSDPLPGKVQEFDLALYELLFTECITIPSDLNDKRWSRLDNLFHPNGTSLVTCVREFMHWNWNLEDPGVAAGQCDPISSSFQSLLIRRKLITYDDIKAKRTTIEEVRFDGCFFHAWNRIGNINIDWTYRQFNPDTPFPFVFHERHTPDAWSEWRQVIKQTAWEMGY